MRLGVVSDTHGQTINALAAVRMLEALQVDAVLHCGDICGLDIPALFKGWRTHFVFGNCDPEEDAPALRQAIAKAGLSCHDRFGDLTLGGRRIALLHSDDVREFRRVRASGDYDLVCYGHSHKAEFHHEGKTLVLNPGALFRANPHSLAIVDLLTMTPTIVPLTH